MKLKLYALFFLNVTALATIHFLYFRPEKTQPRTEMVAIFNATKQPVVCQQQDVAEKVIPKPTETAVPPPLPPNFFKPFESIWDEKSLKHQIRLFSALDAVLTAERISYYVWGGSMLAVVRNNSISPWDDDSDFATDVTNYPKIAALESVFKSFGINMHNHSVIGLKLSLADNPPVNHKFPWSWPFVDIWRFERKLLQDKKEYFVQEYPRRVFKITDLVPPRRSFNEGLLMMTAGDPNRWLYKYFGADIKGSCLGTMWNHRKEIPNPKDMWAEAVNCSSLEPLHPFRKTKFEDYPASIQLIPNKYHQVEAKSEGVWKFITEPTAICQSPGFRAPFVAIVDHLIDEGGFFYYCQEIPTIPTNATLWLGKPTKSNLIEGLAATKSHPLLFILKEKLASATWPLTPKVVLEALAGFEKYYVLEEFDF